MKFSFRLNGDSAVFSLEDGPSHVQTFLLIFFLKPKKTPKPTGI